jgi:hypothetical protein
MVGAKDPPWMAKDWTTWSATDCHAVLTSSPWTYSSQHTLEANKGVGYAYSFVFVQLRSALPIRQALLRQLQLEKHYDRMNPQKKQEFDRQNPIELAGGDGESVLVDITNGSAEPPPSGSRAPDNFVGANPPQQAALRLSNGTLVKPLKTSILKRNTFLNECEYLFPRSIEGKPIFVFGDSVLEIMLGDPLTIDEKTKRVVQEGINSARLGYSFKISDLMYKGKLEY